MSAGSSEHYLKCELSERLSSDPAILDFLEAGATDGLWYWDIENPGQEWMSPRCKKLFGYEDHEIPNNTEWWRRNIHPDDLPVLIEDFRRHCVNPDHPYDQVVRYRHKDGYLVWVRCRGMAVRDGSGKAIRMLGAHTDVTALKESEARLTAQGEKLSRIVEEVKATNEALSAFAHMASHDLQEPLRTLVSYTALLREDMGGNLSEEAARDLKYVSDAAHRMQRLVQSLLALSRADRGDLQSEPLRLDDCVDASLQALQKRLQETGARVLREPLPLVSGDRALLTQIYQNLLSNAMKFNVAGRPEIQLTADQHDGQWTFGVRDNGIGIEPEAAGRIFAPFNRLHGVGEYEGSGIGLAICRKAVERHGGKIWVESQPGEGSHFKFTLLVDSHE